MRPPALLRRAPHSLSGGWNRCALGPHLRYNRANETAAEEECLVRQWPEGGVNEAGTARFEAFEAEPATVPLPSPAD